MPDSQEQTKSGRGSSNDDAKKRNSPTEIDDRDCGGSGCYGYDDYGGSREGGTTYGPMVRSSSYQEKFLAARSWLISNRQSTSNLANWLPWASVPLVTIVAGKVLHRKIAGVIASSSLLASFAAWAKNSGEEVIDPLSLLTNPRLSDQEALEWAQKEQYFPIISQLLRSLEQRFCPDLAPDPTAMPPFCQQG